MFVVIYLVRSVAVAARRWMSSTVQCAGCPHSG